MSGPPAAGPGAASSPPRVVLAIVTDLMDRSKVSAAAQGAGVAVTFIPVSRVDPAAAADLVLVDLSRPGALDAAALLATAGRVVIAFGSHVDTEVLAAARAVGCHQVLARSVFFARLPALLGGPSPDGEIETDPPA